MKNAVLIICAITILLAGCVFFNNVRASGELEEYDEDEEILSGDYDDYGLLDDEAPVVVTNDTGIVTVDGKAVNPGAYYITSNSFDVKTNVSFPDLVTLVYNKKTREYDEVHHEAEREILIAAKIGILEGYEDGTFKPDNSITRAEFLQMLMKLVTNRTFNFEAVPTIYYNCAGKFVTLAEMQGIINRNQYSEEELEEPITRLEVVLMLAKAQIKMKGIQQNQAGHLVFTDIDGLTKEEKDLLLHAASYDLFEGMKDEKMTLFEPDKEITRAETARALVRVY